ncbi:MAG: hypothetical protein A2252_09565 [Elusimicrobia bacterium RIFOXYA2_FULL_39_19]|nr:MAG: hypothetical protein A2252_09565 [Elusimicrobia bacterium RIFOXYA2_FULL_39_19]
METTESRGRSIPNGLKWFHYAHPDDMKMIDVVVQSKTLKKTYNKVKRETSKAKTYKLALTLKVTEVTFPDIYKLAKEASAILNIQQPDVYICNDPEIQAEGYGVNKDHYIVICSGLIEKLTPNEALYVIGHEMGHIQCEHAIWRQVAEKSNPKFFKDHIPKNKTNTKKARLLLEWSRKAELTADRAGLIACQDINDACRVKIKTTCGLKDIPKSLTKEEFLKQMEEIEKSPFAKEVFKYEKTWTHPFQITRMKELIYFSQSEQYKNIVSGIELPKQENIIGKTKV